MPTSNAATMVAPARGSVLHGRGSKERGARQPWPALEKVILTPAGRASLELELRQLREELLPALAAQCAEAWDDPATRTEGADLLAVQQDLHRGERRARELEWLLTVAREMAPPANGVIALGSRVEIEDSGEHDMFQVVDPREANIAQRRVSIASPVGQALLGHSAGDEVVVEAPLGERSIRIVAVS